jgi:hypothetical protein
MVRVQVLLAVLLFVPASLAQTAEPPPSDGAKSTNRYDADISANSGLDRAHINDGDFDLLLPHELTAEDPFADAHSYRQVPAFNPPHSAEEVGKDPCSHALLMVGLGGDSVSDVGVRGDNNKEFVASPPSGGIAVVEIDDRCVKDMKPEDVLSRLASEGQGVEGLAPTARMISYQVDGRPVWFAMSSGFSKDEHGKRTAKAGMTYVADISLSVGGHFFVLGIVTNDVDLFNRMLRIRIQFSGPSRLLVPFALTKGPRADAVPK